MRLLILCALASAIMSPVAHADFKIFDSTGIKTLPAELYDEKVPSIYMWELFTANGVKWPVPGQAAYCEINVEQIQAKALEYLSTPRVILDVEGNGEKNPDGSWKNPCLAQYLLDSRSDDIEAAIDRYLAIVHAWREVNPHTRIGFYGLVSVPMKVVLKERGYNWGWLKNRKRFIKKQQTIRRLVAEVDDLYPGAYWTGTFPSAYADSVELMMETIREYHGDIPVYPFIWYRKGVNNPVHQAATFQFILDTMYAHTDGVVLWAARAERGTKDVKQDAFMLPQNGKPMGWQAQWMRESNWQSHYRESQWMYVLRDFREQQD